MYRYAVLLGPELGISVFGEPMPFEIAYQQAKKGENIWTQNSIDALALAEAVALHYGGNVTGPENGKNGTECMHYHVKYANNKLPNHFFFGDENVQPEMDFFFGGGE